MKKLKQFLQIFLVIFFLTSCKTEINKDYPKINSKESINENNDSEKKVPLFLSN